MYDGRVTWTGELSGRQLEAYPWKKQMPSRPRSSGSGNDSDNGSGGGSGSGTGGTPAPAPFQWTFPQYSQSWAFTPPTPTPYMNPPRFDPKSSTGYFGMASSTKDGKDSKSSGLSLMDLWKRYGLT
jgi:hypothetical protein